tara:strand:+ start:3251 stop:4027 length:777 start_codon:yes stop_codon:yes gene_type:complete
VSDTPKTDPHDEAVDGTEQPFLEHLLELRSRILRSLIAVAILFMPMYYFANELFELVARPLLERLPAGAGMIATQVASPFLTPFKLALFAAVAIGIPFLLNQLWGFIAPGLYRKEKRFAVPVLVSSTILFYAGMAFSYFLVMPLVFAFFTQVAPDGVSIMTDINHYLNFILKMFLAFGLAFEIPIVTTLLALTGLASADGMAKKRPYVIIGCFVVGMLLTPPDVISQLLLALPTWLLFELGVVLARLIERKPKQAAED